VHDASGDPTQAVDLSAMPLFKPATKEQFTTLTNTLAPLLTAQSKKPQYALWLPEFAKQLAKELPSGDIKKVASALTTLSNEKMKEERAADKGSKKTKAAKTKVSLVASRSDKIETTSYDDDGLDDDDFM
jgi:translation initiation factor 3 subunit J